MLSNFFAPPEKTPGGTMRGVILLLKVDAQAETAELMEKHVE